MLVVPLVLEDVVAEIVAVEFVDAADAAEDADDAAEDAAEGDADAMEAMELSAAAALVAAGDPADEFVSNWLYGGNTSKMMTHQFRPQRLYSTN